MVAQARLHGERGEWDKVVELGRALMDAGLELPMAYALTGDGLKKLGRLEESRAVLTAALERFPRDADLEGRLGALLLELEDYDGALEYLARARAKKKRDPSLLTYSAAALLKAGRHEEAEGLLAQALLSGGGLDTKLVLALVKGRRGRLAEADALAAEVESRATEVGLQWAARAVRADSRLLMGDAAGALERWKAIDEAGVLQPGQAAHMAYAAQLVGEVELADRLIARRMAQGAKAEDLLLFAQVDNLRKEPGRALERLAAAELAEGERGPGWEFQSEATRGRALRLAGRSADAALALTAASARPEASLRFGASVWVDLGHLEADGGDFDRAIEHFRHALALDPEDPEAKRALELSQRRVAWRDELAASTEDRVGAAQAEVEALRRRFLAREGEVDELRAEIERIKSSAAAAVRRAQEEAEAEKTRARAEQQRQLKAELDAQEKDSLAKATENLALAFGDATVPEVLRPLFLVAERTYQQALYTQLPAAAVAVLFSGALERSLLELLVRPFDVWLEGQGRRARFLEAATRERRGRRVEYFDRLVEAFDRELDARAPSLGEVARVLERRHEPYLAPFAAFLGESFSLDDAFFEALAGFVKWSKEKLRDPVAHGRLEIEWDELKHFREQLLFRFADRPRGALPSLVHARRGR